VRIYLDIVDADRFQDIKTTGGNKKEQLNGVIEVNEVEFFVSLSPMI
jgi:hypothetical protein